MNSAAIATPVEDVQGDGRWMSMHQGFIAEAKEREPEVLLIGDSLIQQLGLCEIWEKHFVPLHCLNFGIGGDQTQNVLWRIQNGELDSMSPKVIVVLAGTNNHQNTAEEVAEGILAIQNTIHEKQPQAQLIILGLPPRGQYHNPLREKMATINSILVEQVPLHAGAQFMHVDPALFVSSIDGSISQRDMYDFLHFTVRGYRKIADQLLEEIQTILKNFMTADTISTGDPDLQ